MKLPLDLPLDLTIGAVVSLAAHGMILHMVGSFSSSAGASPGADPQVAPAAHLELALLAPSEWPPPTASAMAHHSARPLERRLEPPVPREQGSALQTWQVAPSSTTSAANLPPPLPRELHPRTEAAYKPDRSSERPPAPLHLSASATASEDSALDALDAEPVEVGASSAGAPTCLEDSSPFVLESPELHYPSRALRRGIEGSVCIGIEVLPSGDVERTWVIRSSGHRDLDRAAAENLERWRFTPGGGRFKKDVRFEIL